MAFYHCALFWRNEINSNNVYKIALLSEKYLNSDRLRTVLFQLNFEIPTYRFFRFLRQLQKQITALLKLCRTNLKLHSRYLCQTLPQKMLLPIKIGESNSEREKSLAQTTLSAWCCFQSNLAYILFSFLHFSISPSLASPTFLIIDAAFYTIFLRESWRLLLLAINYHVFQIRRFDYPPLSQLPL